MYRWSLLRVVDHYPDTQAYTNSLNPEVMKKKVHVSDYSCPQNSDFE